MSTVPTTPTDSIAETEEAREAVAQRLERLARRIRTQTQGARVGQLDAAYSEIVKLAARLKGLLA